MKSTIFLLFLATSCFLQAQTIPKNEEISWSTLNQLGIESYEKGNYPKATEWF